MLTNYAELLFNPVERMLVVRPCKVDHPNAIPWDSNSRGASSLSKVLFATMGWEDDYSYRIPCQPLEGPNEEVVLFFDLDNYVGRAINKAEEVIIARKQVEMETDNSGKSYFYPPEDDEEPQEIKDMEEKFQQALEVNKKIFGTPAFQHESGVRGLSADSADEEWDMMVVDIILPSTT